MCPNDTENVKIIIGQVVRQMTCGWLGIFLKHKCVCVCVCLSEKKRRKCQWLLSIMSLFIFNGVYWSLRSMVVCLCVFPNTEGGSWRPAGKSVLSL